MIKEPLTSVAINVILWSLFYFQGIDDRVLVEIFLEGGSEFTAIVLDIGSGHDCHPVVLLPTEVWSLSHNIYIKVCFIISQFNMGTIAIGVSLGQAEFQNYSLETM